MRDSARSGCQRGRSPAAEGAPPPRAVRLSLPGRGNHGVQRGGRRRQRRGGGEGEWQEEETGRPGHGLAHLLQRRHDRGVSGRGHAVGRPCGASAGRGGSRCSAAGARRGPGDPGGWRSRGAAGYESRGRGEPPAAGLALSCPALPNTVQRCQPPARHPGPAAEVKYSRDRNAGPGCRAGRVSPHRCHLSTARLRDSPRTSPGGAAGRGEAKAPLGVAGGLGASCPGGGSRPRPALSAHAPADLWRLLQVRPPRLRASRARIGSRRGRGFQSRAWSPAAAGAW